MEIQKWPASVTLIRHAESAFNKSKTERKENPAYQKFAELFDQEYAAISFAKVIRKEFPSAELLAMTMELVDTLEAPDYSDYDTPLSDQGKLQAFKTGQYLDDNITLPDAVYVSPFLRTRQTLEQIQEGWRRLKDVKTIEDDRLREQEHGVKTMFPDGKIYLVMNPQQALLRKFGTDYDYREEGGESMLDVRDRVRGFINTLIREHGGLEDGIVTTPENVLMVSHHLTIMATRANLERWDRAKFLDEDKHNHPINCGITIYKGYPQGSPEAGNSKQGKLCLDKYNVKLY